MIVAVACGHHRGSEFTEEAKPRVYSKPGSEPASQDARRRQLVSGTAAVTLVDQ